MTHALWPGFNHLGSSAPAPARRAVLLGVLLGALLALAWLQTEREALEPLQGQQQAIKAEIQQLDADWRQAKEQARLAQLGREELARVQSWQASRLHLLDSLEALAHSSDMRLLHLRFEDQVLSVQGQAASIPLQPWVDGVNSRLAGWGAGELQELSMQATSSAEPLRFSLRWTAPAAQLAP